MALKFPPQDLLSRSGSPDQQSYEAVGLEFLDLVKEFGHLQTSSRVLDLGCGTGRIGQHLLGCLENQNQYFGQDVDLAAVEWFRSIAPGIGTYVGNCIAPQCPDAWADIVLVASPFTHMDQVQVRKSLTNIIPKLAPGGVVLATFFILTPGAQEKMKAYQPDFQFIRGTGEMRRSRSDPNNIAYSEGWIRDTFKSLGFNIRVLQGWWLGHDVQGNTFQDLVLARRM